jgi:hypothetical protein
MRHLMSLQLSEMREAARGSNVHVLDCDSVIVDGVRFLGATLWTDFSLPIRAPDGQPMDVERALEEANRRLIDYYRIRFEHVGPPAASQRRSRAVIHGRRLRAEDTLAAHHSARQWLQERLAEGFGGATIVVTHHAPALESLDQRLTPNWLTPTFASVLPAAFFRVPSLWIHGHTHVATDYKHFGCRIVSNPRGYKEKRSLFSNPSFDAGLVIEVALAPLEE